MSSSLTPSLIIISSRIHSKAAFDLQRFSRILPRWDAVNLSSFLLFWVTWQRSLDNHCLEADYAFRIKWYKYHILGSFRGFSPICIMTSYELYLCSHKLQVWTCGQSCLSVLYDFTTYSCTFWLVFILMDLFWVLFIHHDDKFITHWLTQFMYMCSGLNSPRFWVLEAKLWRPHG